MLKKLSIKTNFVLIGIVIGLFVGVSIHQVFGQAMNDGTVRADNLTVSTSGQSENGFMVASGNALVAGSVGIGTTLPATSLDVVGTITASASICIGTGTEVTCITRDQLRALLSGGTPPITDSTIVCDSAHIWDANTSSCVEGSGSIVITTPSVLPKFKKGQSPYIQLAYTGGSGTPTWSIISGALPHDLYFDTMKGTIEGNRIAIDNNPARGVVTFTVKVTVGSQSATKQFSIEEITASDPRPVASDLTYNVYTNAHMREVGDYSLNFGSSMAYTTNETCSVVSGQLPPGTAMNPACRITGIPTTVGTYSIVYKVQNQSGSDTGNITIGVTNPARMRILTNSLPDGTVGQPYNAGINFQADAGVVGIYQSGDRTSVPPGLSYVYAQGGRSLTASIVGTPTQAGSYDISVGITAGGNTNIGERKVFRVTIQP